MTNAKKANLLPTEYVVGFCGSFETFLKGFGLYVADETHEFKEEEYNERIEEIVVEPPKIEEVKDDMEEEKVVKP